MEKKLSAELEKDRARMTLEAQKEKQAVYWENQIYYERLRHDNIMDEIAAMKQAGITSLIRDKEYIKGKDKNA